jgi:hypothetical protein
VPTFESRDSGPGRPPGGGGGGGAQMMGRIRHEAQPGWTRRRSLRLTQTVTQGPAGESGPRMPLTRMPVLPRRELNFLNLLAAADDSESEPASETQAEGRDFF